MGSIHTLHNVICYILLFDTVLCAVVKLNKFRKIFITKK